MPSSPPSPAPTPAIVVEAALLCAGRPLSLVELTALFDFELSEDQVRAVVLQVGALWVQEGRGFELAGDDTAWRVRSGVAMAEHLGRMEPRQRHKYSSAVLETLAVIAYLQPCTRTIIEEHRRRAVTPGVLEQLTERGWVEVIGHQESPGRPALYATTFKFLDDLGLVSIADLPPLDGTAVVESAADKNALEGPDPDDPWEGEDPRISVDVGVDDLLPALDSTTQPGPAPDELPGRMGPPPPADALHERLTEEDEAPDM